LDPPEPVTATVTFTLFPQISTTPGSITIPPGTRFAMRSLLMSQFPTSAEPLVEHGQVIFETYQPIDVPVRSLHSPPVFSSLAITSLPEPTQLSFLVRSKVPAIVDTPEELGISNGQADQIFYLAKGPVLVDEINVGTSSYNPNPRIRVGNDVWQYVVDFLD